MQRLAQDYVRGLAQLAGFPEDQAEPLALAVWEACRNAIEHAFAEEEPGTLKLAGEVTPVALTLSLGDKGLPYYQTKGFRSPAQSPGSPAQGFQGLPSLQECFDEVSWIYHGVGGNELRLTKNLTEAFPLPAPQPETPGPWAEAVTPAGPDVYTIRRLRPGDGIQVARLLYRVYGYHYFEDYYYPDRLDHEVAVGRQVGVVAVADDGEFAGLEIVARWEPGPLGRWCALAVAPAHRGRGLSQRLSDRLQEEIRPMGLIGAFGDPLAIHTISQQICESLGFHVTGIQLLEVLTHLQTLRGRNGPGRPWEREVEPGLQRVTTVFYFQYLAPPEPKAVGAPPQHRELLAKIYENLGVKVQFLKPRRPMGAGELKVHYDQTLEVGTIQVNRVGRDTLPEISQARRDLCDLTGAKVVGLLLPLAQGGTPYLCEAAEAEGFFFSGVLPHFALDGDFLRLQYLNTDLDPERIHLYSPFAKELLAYILQEKERVGQ
ncbi:MAG: GNAT family N-acetyltransferase [Thermodesulfobacteriota bacterium]